MVQLGSQFGGPFGSPYGHHVCCPFGVTSFVVPLVIQIWLSIWWAIWSCSQRVIWSAKDGGPKLVSHFLDHLCAKVAGPIDDLNLMVYLLGHPVMKSVVHYVEYLVTKLVAPFVVHSW